jgi:sulfotransferase
MVEMIHFVSGLPRSGSTLLSALLRQNPRFSAAVTSPVLALCGALMEKMSGAGEFSSFFDNDRRRALLRGVFDGYYAPIDGGSVVFDTNRLWTGRIPLLKELYPEARIICCVRDVCWIIDSIERMLRKNPLQLSRSFNFKPGSSIYERVEILMNSESGLIGLPWSTLREAWFSEEATRMILIPYDNLVREPEIILGRLYAELQEEPFTHDFDHVSYDEPEYDAVLGMPGMHKVREKVGFETREMCLPPDIIGRYSETSFWLRPGANRRGVKIL